ncbi:hypothetical protein ZIOFF_055169 [Zingiber officinale]|uniref:Uncharacterized protein n=1 Tax=Zingiber officinale TaxID=94328 RepID=A0A8J5KNA8_ZINOF|nr:hypothetical protein ZIOFF_055169 [Zingiber officinale]
MEGGEVRKVSREDIQLIVYYAFSSLLLVKFQVQNLIERCLQLYMNQKEVIDTLSIQAKIEPSFTQLVWQKLEEENREFFEAYHVRLIVKNQIMVFNKLLEKQVEMMQTACPSGVSRMPLPNGSNSSSMHQPPLCYIPQHTSTSAQLDGMICDGGFPNAIMNGRPSQQEGIYLDNDSSILAESMNPSMSMLSSHDSNTAGIRGMHRTLVKSEPNYLNNSEFPFSNDSSILDTHQSIGDASVGSFSSSELTGQPLNDTLLDIDTSTLGFSHIPRNFSFSDLTDDFAHCTG